MYNVSKGNNTLEESEILEPLHACLREVLEMERQGRGLNYRYTDHDVIAASLMYATILSNRLIHHLKDEKAGIGLANEVGQHYTALIREITLGMTGIDTSTFFKERKEKKNG